MSFLNLLFWGGFLALFSAAGVFASFLPKDDFLFLRDLTDEELIEKKSSLRKLRATEAFNLPLWEALCKEMKERGLE